MPSLARCILAIFALTLAPPAAAQAWPARPIRLVVNAAAGGSTDVIARSMAPQLGDALGQQIVIDNRPGVGGNVGLEVVVRSSPDGHTLLHSADSAIVVSTHLYKLPFDVGKDVDPIAPTARAGLFVIARAGLPVKTLPELIAYARANPGKLNYGSAGSGTLQHIATEMLMREARIQVVHVPYKGSQQVLVDLVGGSIDFTFDLGAAIPLIKTGKVRLIAVPGATRSALFPDTPTMIETGTNVQITWQSGVYAPAGTPREIIMRVNREVGRIMQTPEARAVLAPMAAEVSAPMSPGEFAAHQSRERARFGAIIREANIRAN
jgi:tripartite-type tricarboxylate transporter receptor subunit TctC